MSSASEWHVLQLLAEPTRRRVYDAVRAADHPMTRDDVATAAGIARRLAAFHLDLLAENGLLDVDYARPPGRRGPGAGRPAKRYRAAAVDVTLSVPARRYDVPARILARAVDEAGDADVRTRAMAVAADEGQQLGRLRRPGGRLAAGRAVDAAAAVLTDLGYEPCRADSGTLRLRNCPFHAVVDVAPALVCGLNHELIAGLLDGMGAPDEVTAELDGTPPDCCVTVARR